MRSFPPTLLFHQELKGNNNVSNQYQRHIRVNKKIGGIYYLSVSLGEKRTIFELSFLPQKLNAGWIMGGRFSRQNAG